MNQNLLILKKYQLTNEEWYHLVNKSSDIQAKFIRDSYCRVTRCSQDRVAKHTVQRLVSLTHNPGYFPYSKKFYNLVMKKLLMLLKNDGVIIKFITIKSKNYKIHPLVTQLRDSFELRGYSKQDAQKLSYQYLSTRKGPNLMLSEKTVQVTGLIGVRIEWPYSL